MNSHRTASRQPSVALRRLIAALATASIVGGIALAVVVVLSAPPDGTAARIGTSSPPSPDLPLVVPAGTPDVVLSSERTLSLDERVAFWEARVQAQSGDYLSALHLVDALLERSRANGDLADLERASVALERATQGAPANDAALPLRRGQLAFSLHEFASARADAESALELDPGNASALALFGDAALETGDYESAAEAYDLLAREGRTPPILSRLARHAWLTGDPEAALVLVAEAVTRAGDEGFADQVAFYQFQLGELLRGSGALDRAADAYTAALQALPLHVPSMGGLAMVREAQGRRAEAIELLESATQRVPTPDLVAALGDLYALDGDEERAERQWVLAERIAEVARATGGVYDRQLVLFLADHNRGADAAVALAEAEIARRTDVFGYDALAWALYDAGRLAEADAAAAQALRLGTPDGRILYHAGLIAEALGRDEEAIQLLREASERRASLPPLQVHELQAALQRLGG
ncbi:MAG TPA: tetratricopeptide repeat protein [Candidatus Dormibacteraeota bacterium]|nr:tetratricopeptide repeat protein [Candidatus Dormibacteraeota bacterium]